MGYADPGFALVHKEANDPEHIIVKLNAKQAGPGGREDVFHEATENLGREIGPGFEETEQGKAVCCIGVLTGCSARWTKGEGEWDYRGSAIVGGHGGLDDEVESHKRIVVLGVRWSQLLY